MLVIRGIFITSELAVFDKSQLVGWLSANYIRIVS